MASVERNGRPTRVSIKDVAAHAGVSVGTVSNVLNRPEHVSATTRTRVERSMQELGFVRNESARQLRAGTSSTLGYIMLDATNPFFTDVAAGIEEVAEQTDSTLFLCNSDQRPEREAAYLDRLAEQRVQGVLITPIDPETPQLDELRQRGIPVVMVDRTRTRTSMCTVSVDDELGGQLAVEHLLDLGHERIACLGGSPRLGQVRERRAGAERAIAMSDNTADELVVIDTDGLSVAEGLTAGERLVGLPSRRRPTAAFCANDLLALGLLQRAVSLGMRVPDDLAIVGYDDIDFAAAAAVPLTSVRQPRRLLGSTAAELLFDEATNPETHEHQQVVFTPDLIARASTRG